MAGAGFTTYSCRAMKDKRVAPVEGPAGASRQRPPRPTPSRLAPVRIILAAIAILTQGTITGSEGQTPVPPGDASQAAQTQPSSASPLAAQARKHPSYQVFAYRFIAPAIAVTNGTTLEVGGQQKINVSRLDQLTRQERETLAGELDVPVGVVDNALASFS